MSYVIQAVLSNPRRPECDQITIPFPIPVDQYDKTIEMLQAIDLGFSVNRDCTVDEVNSRYSVLNTLVGTLVNIDQLDYLAKRLDGFCAGEVSQFQAMAHKLGLSEIKDFINLTYCCQQTTVITDFSDLEQIGKDHTMTLNGGAMPMDQYQAVNGKEAALQLINGGRGVITPYGVAYDNGMELEPVYNGHQFPSYVIEHINTPERQVTHQLPLEGAMQLYAGLDCEDKRLGVTKDSIAAVDLAIHWDGREWLSEDRLRMDEFKDDPVVAEAAAHLRQVLDESPAVGRVTFASGERWNYTDPEKYLQAVREELPCHAATGFRCETLTDDPEVRKAVDDMFCGLYGEENPRQIEDYGGTGMTMGGIT